MGEHMKGLPELGRHVAGALEDARITDGASARVRERLARGEPRAVSPPLRVRKSALFGAVAAAAVLLLGVLALHEATERARALTFVIGLESHSARASASRCCSPVESFRADRCPSVARPTRASSSFARAQRSRRSKPAAESA